MAAITDLSDLVNRLTGGNNGTPETLFMQKVPRTMAGTAQTASIGGRGASLWTYAGFPAGGSAPGAGAIPTNATVGAFPFTNAGAGREKWMIGASAISVVAGTYIIYDRLFHISGLSGTVTAAQTVQGSPATPALTRNTGGAGNFAMYEIYTAIGATSSTLTMSYTNQAGTAGQSATMNIGATNFREVNRAQQIPLASGDTGIQSVQSVTLTATTGLAGDFGITIGRPLVSLTVCAVGIAAVRDFTTGLPGIPKIDDNACLSVLFYPATATATEAMFSVSMVEK